MSIRSSVVIPLALLGIGLVLLPAAAARSASVPGALPPTPAAAAPTGEATAGPLDGVAFLAGHWRARLGADPEGAGGMLVEEVWLPPAGGNMTAAFRMVPPDGGPTLFELCTIDAGANGPELRLRHFHPGLVPWEAEADGPVHLPAATIERDGDTRRVTFAPAPGTEAAVTSIAYARTGNRLVATVAMHGGDRFVIPFERVRGE